MDKESISYATGKRKSAISRIWMMPGNGKITINKRDVDDYFAVKTAKATLIKPLILTNTLESFDIKIMVKGGGISGQAGSMSHGITKALMQVNPELRSVLKKNGLVKRDARVKERKKYGQKGARARFQFSKR